MKSINFKGHGWSDYIDDLVLGEPWHRGWDQIYIQLARNEFKWKARRMIRKDF